MPTTTSCYYVVVCASKGAMDVTTQGYNVPRKNNDYVFTSVGAAKRAATKVLDSYARSNIGAYVWTTEKGARTMCAYRLSYKHSWMDQ